MERAAATVVAAAAVLVSGWILAPLALSFALAATPVSLGAPPASGFYKTFDDYASANFSTTGWKSSFNVWSRFKIHEWKSSDFKINETMLLSTELENVAWKNVDARGGRWTQLVVHNLDIQASNLSGLRIERSRFVGAHIRNSEIRSLYIADTVFEDSILPEIIKSEAILINVEFRNCRFEK